MIENSMVKSLAQGFQDFMSVYSTDLRRHNEMERITRKIIDDISRGLDARDVTKLSLVLSRFSDEAGTISTGIYLSDCIQRCREKEVEICTLVYPHSPELIASYIKNKTLIVRGDLGELPSIEGGRVEVYGNAHNPGDFMQRGELIIHGGESLESRQVAFNMTGGRLVIEGEIRNRIGCAMCGGEVHVESGTKEELYRKIFDIKTSHTRPPTISLGNIYWRGELVVKDGRRVT